ncbi:MAG: hypothetical protein ACYDBJ_27810 [Aggregatilineales bacterium]
MIDSNENLLTRIQAAIHLGITADQFDKLKRRAGTQAAARLCKRNLYALGDVDQLKPAVLDLKTARRRRRY